MVIGKKNVIGKGDIKMYRIMFRVGGIWLEFDLYIVFMFGCC